jgi:phosphoserine phosphatase RsbU/P
MGSLINLLPAIYFACSDEGVLMEVNDELCKHLGYTQADLAGTKAERIFTIATRIFWQTHMFPLLKLQGEAEEIYITLLSSKQEHLPLLINARRIRKGSQWLNLYVGIVVHNRQKFEEELIASKKAAEAALNDNLALQDLRRKLENHIEQLDKQMVLAGKQHEELRQFNRVVTHDLQEPLRKLLMFVNLLLDGDPVEPERSLAEKIKRTAEQMRSIVAGLQQYIWLTENSVNFQKVDLNALLLKAEHEVKAAFPDVQLSVEKTQLPEIEGNEDQLYALFYQLFTNAVRFRKENAGVQINVEATILQENLFKQVIGKYRYREALRVQFTDKGTGFDNTFKDQVFDLFKRLHPQSGSGIGLALCKKIIQHHHGTIDIESQINDHTTVTIMVPLNQNSQIEAS